ncbi:MAG: YihA family ribosome biogenesis GTP-binding protein [Candidatus Amoebophilus sp. 36-38]|nr:MAG: YihA family ribosome biogenesis GTP-binding protein [Candidatus Amoebophilus sp. 36-38]
MHIQEAIFVTSSGNYKKCPPPDKPEIAFIGRSNVGKSSLINMLVGRKSLAKTSARPGKTQLINHFLVNKSFYLVDLPGYGWAQASKTQRIGWNEMVNQYLLHRENLVSLFVLLDIRLPPQKIDLIFINWLINNNIPFTLLLTKADKISKQQITIQLNNFKQILAVTSTNPLNYFVTSSKNQLGKSEILDFIEQIVIGYKMV